ncbi:MAG: F0F1 ATP synthase subunit alpha [Mycoplasmoidaceae bacterium]|nr:MAG: F0F1 ATP synthase subunit alpha [Mycoplasmoidaceae bacterium]
MNKDTFINQIKAKISSYEKKTSFTEEGKVIAINDGVAIVSGLDNVMLNETLLFENGTFGIALNLETTNVGVVLFGKYENIKEGSSVKRTKSVISVPVGDKLLGRVIDPLGNPLDDESDLSNCKKMPIERPAPGIMEREPINASLHTGSLTIDSMFPIGKGQRELIVGDRQTGKTSLAIDAIINQKGKSVKCIYVSIGQKNSSLARIIKILNENQALKFTTIVAAGASDLTGITYIAPYSGMTIAEEWARKGDDVLIVFDDLTKHAVSYRTMSLLLKRPSGREAYPGDVFYLHSRLLERSCKLNKESGGGTITAIPIIETQNSDISTYIPTNTISITDGQIFLQSSLFNIGQRPAIDIGLSVSRVGSKAQNKMIKKLSKSLKAALSEYYDMVSFSQFGNELEESTAKIIENGKKILVLLKQRNSQPLESIDIAMLLFLVHANIIEFINLENISSFKEEYLISIKETKIYKEIAVTNDINDKQYDILRAIVTDYASKFNKDGAMKQAIRRKK